MNDYLGDGLDAEFDGWQINLSTPRDDGTHWVCLEPETFAALIRFARSINDKYGVEHFRIGNKLEGGSTEREARG